MAGHTDTGGGRQGNRWRVAAWSAVVLLLLVPLVAMQFNDQVHWSAADFAFAAVLLIGTGVAYELAVRKSGDVAYRGAVGVALAAAFILMWVNGAVGIIGDEGNGANLMFGGVLAVGVIGSVIARFQPSGMSVAMFATAVAQAAVGVIALAARLGSTGPRWPMDVLALTGFFVAMFLGSALLFRRAARQPTP